MSYRSIVIFRPTPAQLEVLIPQYITAPDADGGVRLYLEDKTHEYAFMLRAKLDAVARPGCQGYLSIRGEA